MSGRSWAYVGYKMTEAANNMLAWDRELSELLEDLSNVCRECEWAENSDYSESDALGSIKRFKSKWFGTDREERLRAYVDDIIRQARDSAYRVLGVESE